MNTNQRRAAGRAAANVRVSLDRCTRALDELHGAGVGVPAPAREAAQVLAALGAALAANADGHPAPAWARSALGIPPSAGGAGTPLASAASEAAPAAGSPAA